MPFEFDNDGYLTPAEIIPCTENEFRDEFIYNLDDNEGYGNRCGRWNEYCDFISFVKRHKLRYPFKAWVFGSIVGRYKIPSDVDIVLFFDRRDWENVNTSYLVDYIKSNAKFIFNVDCSHIFHIPVNDQDHEDLEAFRIRLPCKGKIDDRPVGALEIIY